MIRGDDVEVTIAVHIAQGHRVWKSARGEGGFSCKGAIAVAQKHADIVVMFIRGDHIESAIAVHIAQGHGEWGISHGEAGWRCKRRQGGNGWQAY